MEHVTGVPLGEVLALVPRVQVLAGAAGLRRPVQSVGVLEDPDALQFMKAGDLVLTTLFAIREDREAQLQLVPALQRRGCVGLAIKLRFVQELPAEMLAQANAAGFPLLHLDAGVPFSEVMLPIIGQVVNRQALVLARQQRAHAALMQAMLEAPGLERLADTLAELLENPVVLRDSAGQVLAVGRWGDDTDGLDLPALARASPRARRQVSSAGTTVHSVEAVAVKGRRLTRVVTPVRTGQHEYGEVQAWEVWRSLGELDLSIIGSISTVIALELANRRALLEVERRYHNEFFAALFSGSTESEADLLARARRFGWDLTRPYCVVALKASADGAPVPDLPAQYYARLLHLAGPGAVVGQAELHTVVLRPVSHGAPSPDRATAAAQQLQPAFGGPPLLVTAGIGSVQSGVAGLRRSFAEARRAIGVGERVWGAGGVFHHAEMGLYPVLDRLAGTPELEQVLTGVRRLLAYDATHHTALLPTLQAYFACLCNVRKVSEQLFTHYNTVVYRLQRIEQITGSSLSNADQGLLLQVALQALKLLGPGA